MPDPPSNLNTPPPPVPSKKKKNLEEEEEFESLQLSIEARRLFDAYKKYKRQNDALEREKSDLLSQNYTIRIQVDQLQGTVNELTTRLESEKRRYQQRSNDSDLEIQGLKKQIIHLKDEASQLQSRLGKATSFHLGDNDVNNSVQLNKVISDIQNRLDEFAMVKGKEVVINEENATRLLQQYRCATKIVGGKGKSVLSAALQRLTLETLFRHLNLYLHQPDALNARSRNQSPPQNPSPTNQQPLQPHQQTPANARRGQPNPRSSSLAPEQNNNSLEVEITTTMVTLCDMVSQLAESRQGSDDVSRATPVKIRQQIYAVLGTRGFCKEGHPFIEHLSNVILEAVGLHRQFKSEERQLEAKKNTVELVREIVHLYFRLNTQEPVPDFTEFFEAGMYIQNSIMEGSWDDDNIEDLEIEVCSFPLISVKGRDNIRRVLSKAQVVARSKR